jgi:hypothetical protein
MAKQYTGIDGSLLVDNVQVARVSDWSFSANADTLETTSLGDFARNYVYGVQSFTGTATVFYYENASNLIEGRAIMDDLLRTTRTPTEPTHTLELRFSGGSTTRAVQFKCALTSVEIAATVGEIIQASINFTVCGPLTAVNLI